MKWLTIISICMTCMLLLSSNGGTADSVKKTQTKIGMPQIKMEKIKLPQPELIGKLSLEETLAKRKSVRRFGDEKINLQQLSQLLWAGQGITRQKTGFRTAPSAGALYPMELYVVTADAIYTYHPRGHSIVKIFDGDARPKLCAAALSQSCVRTAPCNIVIAGNVKKTAAKYRARARQYMLIEAGHIAQNILLQAVSLGLGAVPVGAFEEPKVIQACKLAPPLEPILIIPIGLLP